MLELILTKMSNYFKHKCQNDFKQKVHNNIYKMSKLLNKNFKKWLSENVKVIFDKNPL